MNTNSELLALAAKAAGIKCLHLDGKGGLVSTEFGEVINWNPLTDDGDALRLAVKCGFFVDTNGMNTRVGFPFVSYAAIEPHNGDPLAATRRAVVRAAAEIGRSMK